MTGCRRTQTPMDARDLARRARGQQRLDHAALAALRGRLAAPLRCPAAHLHTAEH